MNGDLVCFSHLRWGFVFQRPNHLMARFARRRRTFFVEEPIIDPSLRAARMMVTRSEEGVHVCTPHLPVARVREVPRVDAARKGVHVRVLVPLSLPEARWPSTT